MLFCQSPLGRSRKIKGCAPRSIEILVRFVLCRAFLLKIENKFPIAIAIDFPDREIIAVLVGHVVLFKYCPTRQPDRTSRSCGPWPTFLVPRVRSYNRDHWRWRLSRRSAPRLAFDRCLCSQCRVSSRWSGG